MKGTRREFLGQSAKLVASGVIGTTMLDKVAEAGPSEVSQTQPTSKPGPIETRKLGRTGLKVTVMILGTGRTNENTVRYGLAKGINFVHTALTYSRGRSIREVGKGIKGPKKNKVYLGLKITWDWNSDEPLNKALKILGREHVDVVFANKHRDPREVAAPAIKERFEKWKKQGKVRFLGLTTHGNMKKIMEAALKTGWYDCLMPSYQLNLRKDYLGIFKECEKKNIGVIAMKTKISEGNTTAVPVYLRDKAVTAICKTMNSLRAVDAYVQSTKRKVSEAEARKIMEIADVSALGRCEMCGACTAACPNGLAVNDIVRSVDYYVDTAHDYEMGRENYVEIASTMNSDHCLDCGTCETACPNGVPIRHFIKRAKGLFC